MSKLHLKTERLTIRDSTEADWQSIVERTTQESVVRFMTWDVTTYAEQTKVVAWIREQGVLTLTTPDKHLEFAVEKDEIVIGNIGFKRPSEVDEPAEIGWSFSPEYWRQGYATEASAALMDWCFRNFELHRFISVCDARNTSSYKLMERLGMRREAHHLKSRFNKGEWVDDFIYAVLKDEWLSRPSPRYTVRTPTQNEEPV